MTTLPQSGCARFSPPYPARPPAPGTPRERASMGGRTSAVAAGSACALTFLPVVAKARVDSRDETLSLGLREAVHATASELATTGGESRPAESRRAAAERRLLLDQDPRLVSTDLARRDEVLRCSCSHAAVCMQLFQRGE